MYIVGLDTPWLQSPFLLHRRRIRRREDIARLRAYGVQQVTIDPTRGLDVVPPSAPTAVSLTPPAAPVALEPPAPSVASVPPPPLQPASPGPELALVRAVHTEAMAAVQSLFEGAKTGAPLNIGVAREVVQSLLATVLSHQAMLVGLIHIRQFETNLYAHSINVSLLALMLGTCQGLDQESLTCLGMGALLHDVGQVYLPLNLVRKPRLYTVYEQRLMQTHPRLGARLLAQNPAVPAEVCRIAAEHHERADGSGYPQHLDGTALLPMSQMVAIADAYETMLTHRQGRPPLLPAQAIKELYQHGRNHEFDLGLVEQMVHCLGIYPIGSLVELENGERGIVIGENPAHALRPVVRILWDPMQRLYAQPVTINLDAPDAATPPRTIVRVLDPVAEGCDITAYVREGVSA